ncbi:MAG: carotenoid 1,2-hydratase [Betaproteobacteria bacterium]|nr:carotenoid 1,2-hydratase [Betaproteobacteria bacterium]NBT75316.1 carotenoid 1,2-hydratase [Betaproteobacteria bacterium]NBY13559.1 carotenoid 1,2-hydratase [Betaproteobacteria bacterium]NCA16191.1 carotenoid 1,2-hydratase [Betaproteobacteria bacterium]
MTERSARSLSRSEDSYALAGSSVHWQHGELLIRIDERAMPLGGRVRGEVRLRAPRLFPFQTALDAQGRHRWGPIAPTADIRAEFEHPKIRWEGHGYLDSNEGDEPIDQPFRSWDWSRTLLPDGSVAVIYDVRPEGATNRLLALSFKPSGEVDNFTPGGRQPLGRTLWGLSRQIRADDHPAPRSSVVKTLEDTPFYARSLLNTQIMGEETLTMHETLDLTRLRSNVVRLMLPFRMPRLR